MNVTFTLMPEPEAKPRIAVGADHAGYHLKEILKNYLLGAGYTVDDVGTWSDESVDYPDFARKVADRVAAGENQIGVLVCGTGIGMSIAANKVEGIRAALAHDSVTARLGREHNDANVLTLGGRIVSDAQGVEIVKDFLAAKFLGGRHERRIEKITEMDKERE